MAPWYAGAVPTGMFGVRWVSKDNNDSFYTVLNAINNAEFRYFDLRGQPAGHHNYNIIQTTWQHRFNERIHTKTEAYLMWERNAAVGGTPSIGPFQFNSGGGLGPTVPGLSLTYAVLNYTMFQISPKDFLTVRNEWVKDEHGTRYGFAGNYTSNTIGWTHYFSPVFQVRPEIGYYRNWNNPAFDNGMRKDMLLAGVDVILRF
jgi:Putative beta-barrel porin-2, OmpL-like. bbp2